MRRTRRQIPTDDFQRGYDRGFEDGYKQGRKGGYEQGIKAGRRLAKGKPEFPSTGPGFLKSRGAPKVLGHELLRQQFIDFVNDWMRGEGVSLPAAVSKYRSVMGRAWKGIREVPDQEQLLRLYQRVKRDSSSI